jgi:hypothetical protein
MSHLLRSEPLRMPHLLSCRWWRVTTGPSPGAWVGFAVVSLTECGTGLVQVLLFLVLLSHSLLFATAAATYARA